MKISMRLVSIVLLALVSISVIQEQSTVYYEVAMETASESEPKTEPVIDSALFVDASLVAVDRKCSVLRIASFNYKFNLIQEFFRPPLFA